jgi:Flp pilus assembly protein CpaB
LRKVSKVKTTLTREAGASVPARRSFRRRPSLAHILIAVAAVLAFAFNFLALQDRDSTQLVAVAAMALSAGTEIDSDVIEWIEIDSSFQSLESLILESETSLLIGSVTSRAVSAGELIAQSGLVPASSAAGLRTMSVPIDPEHAAGSTLVKADRVDVISIVDGQPTFVATDLEVVEVSQASQSGIAGSGANYVLVAVTADDALALARAIEEGSIEIVRSSGASPIEGGNGS